MISSFSILKQVGIPLAESRVATHFALVTDTPIQSITLEELDQAADSLKTGRLLPVGGVEFTRKAMLLAGIDEPPNFTYPHCLRDYLRREITQRRAGSIVGEWFIKPAQVTKQFTGFVFHTMTDPETLEETERFAYEEFLALPPDTLVWASEPVVWVSEFRYYVIGSEVKGWARYDCGPDEAPEPDLNLVQDMAQKMALSCGAPAAFTLDVGVLASGETALIECNDAWAIGYYKGSLSQHDYMHMLWVRWAQIAK